MAVTVMEESQKLSRLINTVYQAATDASRLRAMLENIAGEIDADLSVLAIRERGNNTAGFTLVAPPSGEPGSGTRCEAGLQSWMVATLDKNPGRTHCLQDLQQGFPVVPDNQGGFKGYDLRDGCSAYFPLKEPRFGFVGFCRKLGREGFDAHHVAVLDLLLPHIQRAFEINLYLDDMSMLHEVAQERYQKSLIGIVLLDDNGKIVFTNSVAELLLNEPGGIGAHDGHLYAESEEETAELNKLVARSIQAARIKGASTDGFLSISRAHLDKSPLSLSVSSHAPKRGARTVPGSNGRALVVMFDPERRQVTQEYVLERLYDLTAAESALATSLAGGKTLAELAAEHAVSRETLRSQLKRVFQKTHTRRQSELVKLVLTGPGSRVI